eukprot:2131537-Rhodomonas_salina.1
MTRVGDQIRCLARHKCRNGGKAHRAQICCKRPLPLAARPPDAATLAPTCPHSVPERMTRVGDQIRCLARHKC